MWKRLCSLCGVIALIGMLFIQPASAQGAHAEKPPLPAEPSLPIDGIIVKFKETSGSLSGEAQAQRAEQLSAAAGVTMHYLRAMSGDAQVMRLPQRLPLEEVQRISERLMALPDVEYAEPDRILQETLVPNDSRYGEQWSFSGTWGIRAPQAWDITTGSSSTVVAVIDTGITDHADLSGRTVPGYDFISALAVANDGNGRDSNASDPGTWVAANECGLGTPARNSSWHGTHVAGTIGANSDNGTGVAGINWNAKILPVRVLGKCGGSLSDVVDGIVWAAGLSVPGVPANPNPARVLNLSLGGSGACSATEQSAISRVIAAGATVVVAAGNSGVNASGFSPANCSGVITVASTHRDGDQPGYSNFGATVEISAPGGDIPLDGGVLSTVDSGTTVPAGDTYRKYQGTSMAAPHVAGVISLMLARNPDLTPAQVLQILQSTARAFPASASFCSGSTNCGAGIVNAEAAVAAVPFVYAISGDAGLAGAILNYIDGAPKIAIADSNGSYSLSVPSGWSGTVTPAKPGYTFSPPSRTYTNVTSDQTAQDYTASLSVYAISGAAGLAGATLSYTDGTPKTVTAGSDGLYTISVPFGWSGTVTPSKPGYTFSPPSTSYTAVIADQPAQNYSATAAVTFNDVPVTYWAWNFVERLYSAGITGGCGTNPARYCPEDTVTRAQMAVFLLRGIHIGTPNYTPPAIGAGSGFGDVPADYWAATWIKQLAAEGITAGCGSGNYCPEHPVTRAQMAVFLLRSKYGPSYAPPGAGASTGFGDVQPDYWAAAWIKQLVTEGITTGCGNGNYCPENPVTRAQMAVFLVRSFNLP
jgi:serine protease